MTTAVSHAAQARIKRLRTAIGEGPHSTLINPEHQLRCILVTLKDQAALELLDAEKKAA